MSKRKIKPTPRLSASQQPMWSLEEIALLRAGISEGLSYGQLRRFRLPRRSRSAIIGKCHRLGLRQSMSPAEHRACSAQHNNAANFSMRIRKGLNLRRETAHHFADIEAHGEAVKTIFELKDDQTCKWPIGDPKQPGFGFCGEHPHDGETYCATHRATAYEPLAIKRPERIERISDFPFRDSVVIPLRKAA